MTIGHVADEPSVSARRELARGHGVPRHPRALQATLPGDLDVYRDVGACDGERLHEGKHADRLEAEIADVHALGRVDDVSGSGPYTVTGTVDSENSFGAMLRSNFQCTVTVTDDKTLTSVDYLE